MVGTTCDDNIIVRFISWFGSIIKGLLKFVGGIILYPLILILLGYLFLLIRWFVMGIRCDKCEDCENK